MLTTILRSPKPNSAHWSRKRWMASPAIASVVSMHWDIRFLACQMPVLHMSQIVQVFRSTAIPTRRHTALKKPLLEYRNLARRLNQGRM